MANQDRQYMILQTNIRAADGTPQPDGSCLIEDGMSYTDPEWWGPFHADGYRIGVEYNVECEIHTDGTPGLMDKVELSWPKKPDTPECRIWSAPDTEDAAMGTAFYIMHGILQQPDFKLPPNAGYGEDGLVMTVMPTALAIARYFSVNNPQLRWENAPGVFDYECAQGLIADAMYDYLKDGMLPQAKEGIDIAKGALRADNGNWGEILQEVYEFHCRSCGEDYNKPHDGTRCPSCGKSSWNHKTDGKAAEAEGWNIFDCDGSADGQWQLCRIDEAAVFQADLDAWAHVRSGGSDLHLKALAFIKDTNPKEYARIMGKGGAK